jgi:aldehyde dehydrogenase (NAD+)
MRIEKGAKIEYGGQHEKEEKFMAPTLLTNITLEMMVMQEEIFGPIATHINFRKK